MSTELECRICGYHCAAPAAGELGACRGNTERFAGVSHHLWKCPRCASIHNIDPVDFADLYRDYPLNQRRLDVFARGTLRNLLRRLERAGLAKDASILDYGCGNGVFIDYLRQRGYTDVHGYDPHVPAFARHPEGRFDCVVANDVIEHVADPRATIADFAALVRPGGMLYIGTADSEPVRMDDLEPHLMRLHQPFHRVIVTERSLHRLAAETGYAMVAHWRRSYMDTPMPFANYRFLDEFSRALGHVLERSFHPSASRVMFRRPRLWLYAFLGYLSPSAYEPAVLLRRPPGAVAAIETTEESQA